LSGNEQECQKKCKNQNVQSTEYCEYSLDVTSCNIYKKTIETDKPQKESNYFMFFIKKMVNSMKNCYYKKEKTKEENEKDLSNKDKENQNSNAVETKKDNTYISSKNSVDFDKSEKCKSCYPDCTGDILRKYQMTNRNEGQCKKICENKNKTVEDTEYCEYFVDAKMCTIYKKTKETKEEDKENSKNEVKENQISNIVETKKDNTYSSRENSADFDKSESKCKSCYPDCTGDILQKYQMTKKNEGNCKQICENKSKTVQNTEYCEYLFDAEMCTIYKKTKKFSKNANEKIRIKKTNSNAKVQKNKNKIN
jgi:hypothetical protein